MSNNNMDDKVKKALESKQVHIKHVLDMALESDPSGHSVFYRRAFAQAVDAGVIDNDGRLLIEVPE